MPNFWKQKNHDAILAHEVLHLVDKAYIEDLHLGNPKKLVWDAHAYHTLFEECSFK